MFDGQLLVRMLADVLARRAAELEVSGAARGACAGDGVQPSPALRAAK